MDLAVIGINHKTAPVEIREKLSFSPQEAIEAGRLLKETLPLKEAVILSTCNRVEIYALCDRNKDYVAGIKGFLGRYHNLNLSEYETRLYIRRNREAVAHLFGVASGLDSMILGEMEILGQVKRAYEDARCAFTTGKALNRLFEKALSTAKKIKTKTSIGQGAVSASSVAVRLAQRALGRLDDKKVLVIGTGKIGEQLLVYLRKNNVRSIMVANRTIEKAWELAARFNAAAVEFRSFPDRLFDADIVIASTAAPHSIIRKAEIASLMGGREDRPLLIIDLAVPRNVEENVNSINNVFLYDIDDLQKIVDENMKSRKGEIDACFEIIDASAGHFINWLASEKIKDEN